MRPASALSPSAARREIARETGISPPPARGHEHGRVLRLRALRVNGDFDAYWQLHLREELRRNHIQRYAPGSLPNPIRPPRSVK